MNILLDTHAFLWAVAEPHRLTASSREALETRLNRVLVSAVSIGELMIKASLGKLALGFDPVEVAARSGFELLPLTGEAALPLRALSFHHRDPFDRLLIARAMTRDFCIMTSDRRFASYPVTLI